MVAFTKKSLQFCILSKFTFGPSCPHLKLLLPFKIITPFGTLAVKVSKFQHELLKSSFLPKYEPKSKSCKDGFLPCSVAQYKVEILTIFGSYFGRNDDFMNSF